MERSEGELPAHTGTRVQHAHAPLQAVCIHRWKDRGLGTPCPQGQSSCGHRTHEKPHEWALPWVCPPGRPPLRWLVRFSSNSCRKPYLEKMNNQMTTRIIWTLT